MMIRVDDDVSLVPEHPMTFAEWVSDGHDAGWPTVDDLAYHLTTLFPPVRPRGWLELRMIDALPEEWWPVAVAVTTALLDDPVAAAPRRRRRGAGARPLARSGARRAARSGARPRRGRVLRPPPARPSTASAPTTRRRAATDEYFDRFVARGRCPADDLLDDWSRLQSAGV